MRIGSLFSGIGGLELGLEAAGMQVVWQCENELYAKEVLRQTWPGIRLYDQVEDLYKKETPEAVDVICGGFPCQPVSCAGARRGRSDRRWLWPEMLRVICAARPKWIVGENVRGLLTAEDGKSFAQVLRSLAKSGYRVGWFLLRAEDVGASHRRERVFILGYSESHYRRRRELREEAGVGTDAIWRERPPGADTELALPEREGQQRRRDLRDVERPTFGDGCEGIQRKRGWDAVVHRDGTMADSARVSKYERAERERVREESPRSDSELADPADDRLRFLGAPFDGHGSDASRYVIDRCDSPADRDLLFRSLFPFPPGPGLTVERVEGIRELFREDPAAARAEFEAELAETLKWAAILEVAPWLNPSIEPDIRGVVDGVSVPLDRHRRKRLRTLGNSVVPQATEIIGRLIMHKEAEEVEWKRSRRLMA